MSWFGFSLIDKVIFWLLLLVLFFTTPWWVTLGVALILAFIVPNFYPVILIGLLLDIVFIKVGGGPFFLSLPMTLVLTLVCLLSAPVRERLIWGK